MKPWNEWHNWVTVAAGVYVALSTMWTPTIGISMPLMITGGVVLALIGVINLATPGMPPIEWAQAVIALLVVGLPWMGSFAGMNSTAWSAWIPGGIALIVSALAIRPSIEEYHAHQHA